MKTRIVRVGRSFGIVVPKSMLEQAGLHGDLEVVVLGRSLFIQVAEPRQGWEESFRAMAERGDDALVLPEVASSLDDEEWDW